jgi:hypothetical protein
LRVGFTFIALIRKGVSGTHHRTIPFTQIPIARRQQQADQWLTTRRTAFTSRPLATNLVSCFPACHPELLGLRTLSQAESILPLAVTGVALLALPWHRWSAVAMC